MVAGEPTLTTKQSGRVLKLRVDITRHQRRERLVRPALNIFRQQIHVRPFIHLPDNVRHPAKR